MQMERYACEVYLGQDRCMQRKRKSNSSAWCRCGIGISSQRSKSLNDICCTTEIEKGAKSACLLASPSYEGNIFNAVCPLCVIVLTQPTEDSNTSDLPFRLDDLGNSNASPSARFEAWRGAQLFKHNGVLDCRTQGPVLAADR
jgi:hypothetical protein